MAPIEFQFAPGATPLDPDEAAALIPAGVATVAQLNDFEAANILSAIEWLDATRINVLDDAFLRELHRRMFGNTWRWAGRYRTSEKNIGVPPHAIAMRVRDLVLDVGAQVENNTAPLDEIAARFHHRLVAIHAFANGNGRHSRLAADLLLEQRGAQPFTWGSSDLGPATPVRETYIAALRAADAHDVGPLLAFVRT